MTTTPRTQPTTAPVSRAIVMDVLALGVQAHPELSVRLSKAADIVLGGGVERGQVAGWWVRSQARDTAYFVTLVHDYRFDQCSCRPRHDLLYTYLSHRWQTKAVAGR